MKELFWTIQKSAIIDKIMEEGEYWPDFNKSDFFSGTKQASQKRDFYDLTNALFIRNNGGKKVEGLVFAFRAYDPESDMKITEIEQFQKFISNKDIDHSWSTFLRKGCEILLIEKEMDFNPLYMDYNDYSVLIPPLTNITDVYDMKDFERIVAEMYYGEVSTPSPYPLNLIQALLPCIKKEDIIGRFPLFELSTEKKYTHKHAKDYEMKDDYGLPACYLTFLGEICQKVEDSIWWFKKAAAKGDEAANCHLGNIFYRYEEYEKAANYYLASAEQGSALSEYNIGVMYYKGICGLDKDEERGIYWIKQAAQQGFDVAIDMLKHPDEATILLY
ncbi:MAG: sel1 repeat family protein [Lachnospiraceae bacterium]|nr:sel1 repeat family protein [Lachnospiraceae bacterium]